MIVKIKKLSDKAIIPTKGSDGAAAFDLYAPEDTFIPQQTRFILKTDIAIELPNGYVADIRPRSGYSAKGFASVNGVRFDADVLLGTIDCDYRGNIGVIIKNCGSPFLVEKGQRIAQMLIHKAEDVEFYETNELSHTMRGNNGFNSTGV